MTAVIMTYSSLFTDVQTYLDRVTDSGLENQIPSFISLAGVRCSRELKTLGFKAVYTNNFVTASAVVPKPARWRETISFNYGTGEAYNDRQPLYPRSYEFCRSYWPNDTVATSTALPKYYADYDYNHWLIVPTPYTGYPYEVSVFEMPVPLSDVNQTNWLTENAPDFILYATLIEAEPFVKNYELMQVWKDNYDRALAAQMGEDKQRRNDNTLKRMDGQ